MGWVWGVPPTLKAARCASMPCDGSSSRCWRRAKAPTAARPPVAATTCGVPVGGARMRGHNARQERGADPLAAGRAAEAAAFGGALRKRARSSPAAGASRRNLHACPPR
jgi:hypothetical protein